MERGRRKEERGIKEREGQGAGKEREGQRRRGRKRDKEGGAGKEREGMKRDKEGGAGEEIEDRRKVKLFHYGQLNYITLNPTYSQLLEAGQGVAGQSPTTHITNYTLQLYLNPSSTCPLVTQRLSMTCCTWPMTSSLSLLCLYT